MRGIRTIAGAAAFCALSAALSSTSCAFQGELVVAVQTDMALPKDIDSIQIMVSVLGTLKYDSTFENIGADPAAIKLPATLALLGPEQVGDPVKIRVIGRKNGLVRVTRDVVTTVPEGRIVMLPIKLEGLCVDFDVEDPTEHTITSRCQAGQTCVAGSCLSSDLSPDVLRDFDAADIFGGGTGRGDGDCFDVTQCFLGAAPLEPLSTSPCTYRAPADTAAFNVAILTEITGSCGAASCLLALDTNNDTGWRRDEKGNVVLPLGVCDPTLPNAVLGVVYAPVTEECRPKTLKLPTCGPWSSVGAAPVVPETPVPTPVALKQPHPVALIAAGTDIYWANTGVPSGAPKSAPSLKRSSTVAGELGVVSGIETKDTKPRGLAVAGANLLFTSADPETLHAGINRIPRSYFVDHIGAPSTLGPESTRPPGSSPDGIAAAHVGTGPLAEDVVIWTEFSAGKIWGATLLPSANLSDVYSVAESQKNPLRVVANSKFFCYAVEGTLGGASGSITCQLFEDPTMPSPMKPPPGPWTIAGQETPRAITIDSAGVVYWATFQESSKIFSVEPFGPDLMSKDPVVEEVAEGQNYTNGVAADSDSIYWTNWGDGTVVKRSRTKSEAPTTLADGQDRPSVIVTTDDAIYWINEGSSTTATGSVMRLSKK